MKSKRPAPLDYYPNTHAPVGITLPLHKMRTSIEKVELQSTLAHPQAFYVRIFHGTANWTKLNKSKNTKIEE